MQVQRSNTARGHHVWLVSRAVATLTAFCGLLAVMPASAQTLERIGQAGRVRLGYLVDARPFSYRNDASDAAGYSVALCQRIAERVESAVAGPELTVEWVPVTADSRVRDIAQGRIDLLCAPMAATLTRREEVSFSIPVFAGGNRAVLRTDAATALRAALAEAPTVRPVWRGSPAAKVLEGTTFAVMSGTTTEDWLEERRAAFQVDAEIVPVADYRTGLQQLVAGDVDVFIGDRAVVLGALDDATRDNVVILDRLLTYEPAALALTRGDEDFRLLVDAALSELYASEGFRELYAGYFGELDESTRSFFQWNTPGQ